MESGCVYTDNDSTNDEEGNYTSHENCTNEHIAPAPINDNKSTGYHDIIDKNNPVDNTGVYRKKQPKAEVKTGNNITNKNM